MSEQLLTGWGRTTPSRAYVDRPATVEHVRRTVVEAPARGVIARGAGRAYGDAAQTAGGVVLDLTGWDDVSLGTDGTVTSGPGATMGAIGDRLLDVGRFLPVSPGTRHVTVGGAIAADVHGKNHHRDSTFGSHVRELDVVLADGDVVTVGRDSTGVERELFLATVGGMGLTGVVTRVRFDTIPVPGALMRVDTQRADDLDHLMSLLADGDRRHRYSVAWVDCAARGRNLGRGVVTQGDHAAAVGSRRSVPDALDRAHPLPVPAHLPNGLLNRWSAAALGEAWFRRAPRLRRGALQPPARFFYPLDGLAHWNRAYGPAGFVQYQFAVPDTGSRVVQLALESLATAGAPSFVSVLKRFGPAGPAYLSFPQPGWTLAVDLPADVPGLAAVLDRLDAETAAVGGRVYLAKDSRLLPGSMELMYPTLPQWRAVKARVDPRGVFVSDLSRRIGL